MSPPHRTAARPFHLMAKPVGAACNLACDYCFYRHRPAAGVTPNDALHVMDEVTLAAFVRIYIQASPAAEVTFAWQGGEPTLAGIAFYERALRLQGRFADGRPIRNALQTNGVLIDDAWARFFADNSFLVGISVDGPPHLHDRHRRTRGGAGSAEAVAAAVKLLRQHGVAFNVLAVVSSTTAPFPREVYHYLVDELGAEFLQFIPLVERLASEEGGALLAPNATPTDARLTASTVVAADWGSFLVAVFDEWRRQDVGRVFVQVFEEALTAWTGRTPTICVMRPTCGDALVVEASGDVYSCDHYVFPDYRLGNVKTDSLAAMVSTKRQKAFGMAKARLPAGCLSCRWLKACRGGCPKHRIEMIGGQRLNHLCEGYKAAFAHMDPILGAMAETLHRTALPGIMRAIPPR